MPFSVNISFGFFKTVTLLAILMMASGQLVSYAEDPAAENAASGILLQNEAPIYMGPVQEGDLEALTLDDFEAFGIGSVIPEEQYRQYKKVLALPPPGIRVPYRMMVVDRDLTLEDFFGFNVSEELSEARYEGYLSMNPSTVDGQTIHYAYVYHAPSARIGAEPQEVESRKENIDLREMV